jgi:Rrf2 family protein
MLRLSKKADYALLAMRHLAAHADRGAMSARELAEEYAIPPELLAKVLQKLVHARLLDSHQGIRGGYGLGRPPATISVADVIQAVDGPLTVTACSEDDRSCDQYAKCNIRDPLWRIKDRIVAALAATSVAELAADMLSPLPAELVPVTLVKRAEAAPAASGGAPGVKTR